MSNSTIKLKSSTTAGNAPSSLETGEFAINVEDGNLFYGSASAVKQDLVLETLTVKGSLTAENYIVSSSVTHMTQSFSSGSTIFGDTQDDTHQFTGSINVTGSISATSFTGDGSGLTGLPSGYTDSDNTDHLNSLNVVSGSVSQVRTFLDISSFGANLINDANNIAARTTLGLGSAAVQAASSFVSVNGDTMTGDLNLDDSDIINVNELRATTVSGSTFSGSVYFSDDVKIASTPDIQNVHLGQVSGGSGGMDVSILSANSVRAIFGPSDTELKGLVEITGGSARLNIAGDISASGDITANSFTGDGSALTSLPSQTDNNFTTTLKNKLDGIEASADVTDTTNVTAAGALMDSEVTNLAQVKAFDSSDYATAAQGTLADTAIQPADTGSFSTATGVENNADVTDTANVTSAGALMDSEVTNLAQVKAFDSSDYATTAQGTKADTAIQPADTGSFSTATGVEDNADVTDTTNVQAAGALMDSEVTNLAQVKAFDSSDYATAAQGSTADSAQQPPSEGAFVNGDKTKLDGIEASADVTDTANVTSAGALMDSEVTNLAQVKAFDSSDYATSAQGTKADSSIQPTDTASFAITGSDVSFGHLSSSFFHVGILDRPFKITGGGSFAATRPTIEGIGGIINVDSGLNITGEYKLSFDNDVTNTYIKANSDNPEDLEIHADQDIILAPDNAVDVQGTLSLPGFTDVSASLAAAVAGGDNLGNHTATQDLNMGSNAITSVGNVDGRDISTDGTKLDGIEASADVTDTANVTSAGALMDSELANLSAVKAINQGLTTTSNVTFASIVGDNVKASGENANALRILDFDGDGFIQFDGKLSTSNAVITIGDPDDGGNSTQIKLTDADRSIQLGTNSNTHVTASGNISASGEIYAESVHINKSGASANEKLFTVTEDGNERFYIDAEGDVNLDSTLTAGSNIIGTRFLASNGGTQSGPAFAFSGDSNTGIYAPSSDQLNIQAGGGTVELYVNTSGVTVNNGTFAIPGFSDVSASLAAAGSGGSSAARFQVNGACFLGQTAQRAMPFGTSTGESTLFTYTTTYMIPVDCKLVRVHTCSQQNAGTATLKAYTIPDATADNTAIANGTLLQTVAVSNHNAGDPFEFTFGSTGTISKGSKFGLTVESTTNPNGFRFTAYFEEV